MTEKRSERNRFPYFCVMIKYVALFILPRRREKKKTRLCEYMYTYFVAT